MNVSLVPVVLFALLVNGGCGSRRENGSADVAVTDSGSGTDQSGDGGAETLIRDPTCESARSICLGADVYTCIDNRPGELLESCPLACSLGRCTAPACASVEEEEGLRGCRFYGVQLDNIDQEDGRHMMVILSNGADEPVEAIVEARVPGGSWTTIGAATVQAQGGARIRFKRPVAEAGVTPGAAFRVETNGPVTAVQLVSDDMDKGSRSSAGTVLRPVQAIGRRHIAVTSPAVATATVRGTAGSRGGAGAITVVATAANTRVTLALTAPAMMYPGGALLDPPPPTYDVPPMHEGEVLQIFSAGAGSDLTGTIISADLPIAVFAGNIFTSYMYELTGFNGGDMAGEQLPPTASWGSEYVGARLSPQIGCDPFFGTGVGLWRVVASQDNTTVRISPAPGVSVDWPDLPAALKFTLAEGQSQSFWTRGNLKVLAPADVVVSADGPILLAQWLDCEPGLSWGIDTRFPSGPSTFTFTLPPGFDHEVVVVKRIGEQLMFKGLPLEQDRFTQVAQGRPYEAVRLERGDLGSCQDAFDRCEYQLAGSGFGVTWRGMDVVCSYALTVPSGDFCALPNVECPR